MIVESSLLYHSFHNRSIVMGDVEHAEVGAEALALTQVHGKGPVPIQGYLARYLRNLGNLHQVSPSLVRSASQFD